MPIKENINNSYPSISLRLIIKLLPISKIIFLSVVLFCVSADAFGEIIKEKICFKHTCIEAEIADSEEKRVKGLMFREDLTESQGMLFVLEPGQKPKFWMKNVKFSLDIIWINEDKRVVDIKTNIPPCRDYCESIGSKQEARYILEVRGGFVNKYQIKIGDEVGFKH